MKQENKIFGLEIIRAYELSWLCDSGKPQLGLLEILQDFGQPLVDTWKLKEFQESVNNKPFHDIEEIKSILKTIVPKANIKIKVQSEFDKIVYFEQTKFNDFSTIISNGLRFICAQSDQPYIGRVNLLLSEDTPENASAIKDLINSVRNLPFMPQTFVNYLYSILKAYLQKDFILSIHLNRRGGISYQAVCSDHAQDFSPFRYRSILE